MVDFTAPNLQGENTQFNNIASKLNDTKNSALSNLQADASAASSALSSQLADVNTELRSLVPEPSSIPNVNLQAQLQSLSGLTNPLQSASLLADITSSFGDALTTSGFDLDSLVSSAAGVFGTGTSLSGLIPNFELSAAGDVIQKASASLLPSIGPVTEEAAAVVSNTNFTAAKTAAASAVLATSDALPTADSGAYKISTKSKKVTQSSGGLAITKEVTTPKEAVENGVRKTVSPKGFSNRVNTITETFKREDAVDNRYLGRNNVVAYIYELKHIPASIENVIGYTTISEFDGKKDTTKFKIVARQYRDPQRGRGVIVNDYNDTYRMMYPDLTGRRIEIGDELRFYDNLTKSVTVTYKYTDTYDPGYAKA